MKNKDSVRYGWIVRAFLLGCLAISFFVSGLYFEFNPGGRPADDQTVLKFDPFSGGGGTKRRLTAQMMTPEFASENGGANHYYFVFDQFLTPYIVKFNGELPEDYNKLIENLYNGQAGDILEPIEMTGWPAPVDDNLSRVAVKAYNTFWGEDVVEESNFTESFGGYFLDTTKKSSDLVSFQVFLLFLTAIILLAVTIVIIVGGVDKRKAGACYAERESSDSME